MNDTPTNDTPTNETPTNDSHISENNIEALFKPSDFPASKDDLLFASKNRGASESLLHFIDQFPDKKYKSLDDITRTVRGIKLARQS